MIKSPEKQNNIANGEHYKHANGKISKNTKVKNEKKWMN